MPTPSRGAVRPSCAWSLDPPESRGRREDRVRAAPAVSCAICTEKCAHEHTGPAESIRPSLRNGLTAYAALSSETNSFCLRRLADWRRRSTRSGTLASAKLDASHGRQDHTVLPYATTSLVLRGIDRSRLSPPCDLSRVQRHRVHRNPHSTYRDDAYAPLHEAGWRKENTVSRRDEADYFRSAGWTTQITLEWLVKFDFSRNGFFNDFYTAADRSTDRFARRARV